MPNNNIICRAHMTLMDALETNVKKDRNVPGCKDIQYIVMNYAFYTLVVSS